MGADVGSHPHSGIAAASTVFRIPGTVYRRLYEFGVEMKEFDMNFEWKWRDSSHLNAHKAEFLRPVEEILDEIRPLATALRVEDHTSLHTEWELDRICGTSGLREVDPLGSESFWAYRKGKKSYTSIHYTQEV